MQTLTPDELARQPQRLLAGEAALVVRDGQALLLTLPLDTGLHAPEVRVELAARLFDQELISLGLSARLAGVSYGEMLEELARREIAVIRTSAEELQGELAAFGA